MNNNTRCKVYGEEKSECKMPVIQSVVFFSQNFIFTGQNRFMIVKVRFLLYNIKRFLRTES